jgi:hypothetical protein
MIGSRYHAMRTGSVMVSVFYKGFKFKALYENMMRFSIMAFLALDEQTPC